MRGTSIDRARQVATAAITAGDRSEQTRGVVAGHLVEAGLPIHIANTSAEGWLSMAFAPATLSVDPDPTAAAIDRLTHAVLVLADLQSLSVGIALAQDVSASEHFAKTCRDMIVTAGRRVEALRDRLAESTGMKP